MFPTLKLGRPFGIDFSIHPTFWLLPLLTLLGGSRTPSLDLAVLFGVFACVGLHEYGHALAARLFGIRTRDIVLYPIGGVARLERMPDKPWQEIVVALAGPAVNVGIALLLLPLVILDGFDSAAAFWPSAGGFLDAFTQRLFSANLFLVAFNLIPAFPMDGGRVLRAVASTFVGRVPATRFAAAVGAAFALLFAVAAVVTVSPLFFLLAVMVFLTGRAEKRAVEQEARFARRRPVMEEVPGERWEFDPVRRAWVVWRE